MKVLVACEFSGIVRDAFLERGYDAWSCDLEPTESSALKHIQGDVLKLLDADWDLLIAHPPCTYLANSGVRWLHEDITRWPKMFEGAEFFKVLLNCSIPRIAVENPVMHKYATSIVGRKSDQTIQPWHFGDNESKAVCLWLKGLDLLVPEVTEKPDKLDQRVWRMPPGPDRQKERSRFFKGIAKAMAEQWGK